MSPSLTCILLVSAMAVGLTSSQPCDPGWFGPPDCKYKCHCTSNTCDVQTGTCTGQDSTCDKGWFGPACQYSDLASLGDITEASLSPGITELSDGNDSTCYTNTNLRSVVVVWNSAYHFTWMRVVAKQDIAENKFTASFKNILDAKEVSCNNARQWMVNSRTVDIHCDLNGTTEMIILRWDGDISLCSVYISGGRNVALKQTAQQTSTARYPDGTETSAFKAVDGVNEPSTDHCSATKLAANVDPDAAWNLSLSRPQLVYRFVIYNRYPDYSQLLQGFNLTSYNKDNALLFTYKDEEDPELDVYTIIHEPQGQPVTRVQISGEQHGRFKAVPLCEVEIYGDNTCIPGLYGRDCEHRCICAVASETCFVSTGGCPSGCPAGLHGEGCQTACPLKYYGGDCKTSCSINCRDQLCDRFNGKCGACAPGKQGDTCEQDCDKGRYGLDCADTCSQNCGGDGSCKPQNGTCVNGCRPGFAPPLCVQPCPEKFYGVNCSQSCSTNCLGKLCDRVTGKCSACAPGKQGNSCDEDCDIGFYGVGCQQECSKNCAGSCYPQNGTCVHGCKPGYATPFCNQSCDAGWFGVNCKYECHCTSNTVCDVQTGTCTGQDSRCDKGWFGPACQYSDLTPLGDVTTTDQQQTKITELKDGNDSTCYSRTGLRSVMVTWQMTYYVTWMRVVAKYSIIGTNFTAEFKNKTNTKTISCDNVIQWMVNSRTVDIHCDLSRTTQQVILSWDRDISLCSVYISGGRNIALKQTAQQTSTARYPDGTETSAFKAVDGVTEPSTDHCSATKLAANIDPDAAWSLSLSRPQLVYRFVIYNRYPDFANRLQGFTLASFTQNNDQIFTYKDKENSVLHVYTIVHGPQEQPVTLVKISGEQQGQYKAVLLCEVEIYGESICNSGLYGRDCEHRCKCAVDSETCFVSTGGCPSGCPAGLHGEGCQTACPAKYYGVNCEQSCSTSCVNQTCEAVSGYCTSGCVKGKYGNLCHEVSRQEGDDSDSTPIPLIAGVVAAVIVVTILVIAGIALWRRRQKPKKSKEPDNRIQGDGIESEASHDVDTSTLNLVDAVIEETDISTSSPAPYHNTLTEIKVSTAIPVKELNAFMMSHDFEYFKAQFQAIPLTNPNATMNVGLSAENRSKNRYKNICTYDHSRVVLQINEAKVEGDYINASFVEGYKNEEKFVASQGPNKIILNDFIRMLWEQRVDKVVMLTNLVEEGKPKCERYWPEEGELQFGDIKVNLEATQVFADYTIRKLRLTKTNEAEHTLTHFHFTSWPDKGVPRTPWALVDFEQRVACIPTTRPIVVHCSAGVGRTGTFIALRNVMKEANDSGQMDFHKTLSQLRRDRVNMIQTSEQYIFLHKAAQVALVCMNTTVTSDDILDRITHLETTSSTGLTYMDKEFDAICHVCADTQNGTTKTANETAEEEDSAHNVYENSQSVSNKLKNRYSNFLPNDFYRPYLTCEIPGTEEYINAVLVPGFTTPDNQILTQLPMPTTVLDLWRLVTQYNVSLMVAMELESAATDSTVINYLPPSEKDPAVCEPFTISGTPTKQGASWEEQVLSISWNTGKTSQFLSGSNKKNHQLTHLKCNNISLNPETLLAFVTQIRSYSTSGNSRTLYMCKNGAAYSGLMCVLSLLLDRMDSDFSLTIPLVVGAIKAIRPQAIPSTEQYRTLYDVLKIYTESTGVYCNFGETRKMRPPSLASPQAQASNRPNFSPQEDKSKTAVTVQPQVLSEPKTPDFQYTNHSNVSPKTQAQNTATSDTQHQQPPSQPIASPQQQVFNKPVVSLQPQVFKQPSDSSEPTYQNQLKVSPKPQARSTPASKLKAEAPGPPASSFKPQAPSPPASSSKPHSPTAPFPNPKPFAPSTPRTVPKPQTPGAPNSNAEPETGEKPITNPKPEVPSPSASGTHAQTTDMSSTSPKPKLMPRTAPSQPNHNGFEEGEINVYANI